MFIEHVLYAGNRAIKEAWFHLLPSRSFSSSMEKRSAKFECRWELASLVAQLVKNPPAMQETLVRFLSQEEPLEKGMAIHSSILAWRIPWREVPGGLQFMGLQSVRHNLATKQQNRIWSKSWCTFYWTFTPQFLFLCKVLTMYNLGSRLKTSCGYSFI